MAEGRAVTPDGVHLLGNACTRLVIHGTRMGWWPPVRSSDFTDYVHADRLALHVCSVTFVLAASTWYTSYTCWQYCMRHPREYEPQKQAYAALSKCADVRDIVDIAYQLTGGSKIAGEATAIMLM